MKTVKQFLTAFLIFTQACPLWAAGVIEKHPTDSFQIGVGSSISQKNFLFDLGLGASNPVLGVDTTLQGLNYSKNVMQWGDGAASQKSFVANIGSGSTNPKIIWDNTNSTWSFSNDGTNFSSFGSGSGGANGIQLLTNGDFESGITLGWTNTGGTFASVSSGSNLLVGKKSATFLASASTQSVQSSLYAIPNGLVGQACAASMMYKGGDIGLTFQVVDNSSNILASQVIQASTNATTIALPFVCPSSGSVRVKILSGATAALIAFDQMFLGSNALISTSQASYVGGVFMPGACFGTATPTTATPMVDLTFSSCGGYTLLGQATAFADSGNGAVTFSNLPPGEYLAQWTGDCNRGTASSTTAYFAETDGTNFGPAVTMNLAPTYTSSTGCVMTGHFSYQTAGTRSFKVQVGASSSETVNFGVNVQPSENFSLYRFPSQSEIAVRPETINWLVDVTQDAATFQLGVLTVASQTEITDTGSTLATTANGASLPVQVPCSGTNPSTGITCSSGTPDAGVVFNLPAAGSVLACASFNHYLGSGGSTTVFTTYEVVETPNNSQTILQHGRDVQTHSVGSNTANTIVGGEALQNCGIFNFTSAGQKTLRLFYNQTVSGPIATNSSMDAPVHWKIRPLTQNVPAPVLVFQKTGFQVTNNGPFTSPGSNTFNTWLVDYDTSNSFNGGGNYWVVPVAGSYQVNASAQMNDGFTYSSGSYLSLDMEKNGVAFGGCLSSTSLNHGSSCSMSKIIDLAVGDQIKMTGGWTCSSDSFCHWIPAGTYFQAQLLH